MKTSKIVMLTAAILPLFLFLLPMWTITLQAPQYPIPLGIEIHVNHMEGQKEGDIQNFDLMNHYVGMKKLPKEMMEFEVFPPIVIGLSILGLIVGFLGRKKLYLVWFALYSILGTLGLYDFYLWLYEYGHNLNSKAAIKLLDSYQPPVFGTEQILNFTVKSYPASGSILLGLGIFLALAAFFIAIKEERKLAK